MRFCPYCGAELAEEGIRFCNAPKVRLECGKELSVPGTDSMEHTAEKETESKAVEQSGDTGKGAGTVRNEKIPVQEGFPVDGDYDGYYDDILPADAGRDGDGPDRELIRKVVILVAVVSLVIAMCISLMVFF